MSWKGLGQETAFLTEVEEGLLSWLEKSLRCYLIARFCESRLAIELTPSPPRLLPAPLPEQLAELTSEAALLRSSN